MPAGKSLRSYTTQTWRWRSPGVTTKYGGRCHCWCLPTNRLAGFAAARQRRGLNDWAQDAVVRALCAHSLVAWYRTVVHPPGEPKRNHDVERVNGLSNFWDRNIFASRQALLRESPQFLQWYETHAPPSLNGQSVAQQPDSINGVNCASDI
ncbi:MAG: hypothetical protein IPM55_09260 [Acidobacteria bacterium]|nr:hypothetical protein [Acidobacteriota bacterium]